MFDTPVAETLFVYAPVSPSAAVMPVVNTSAQETAAAKPVANTSVSGAVVVIQSVAVPVVKLVLAVLDSQRHTVFSTFFYQRLLFFFNVLYHFLRLKHSLCCIRFFNTHPLGPVCFCFDFILLCFIEPFLPVLLHIFPLFITLSHVFIVPFQISPTPIDH